MAIQQAIFSSSFDRVRSMRDVSPMDLFNDAILGVSNALLDKGQEMYGDAEASYAPLVNPEEQPQDEWPEQSPVAEIPPPEDYASAFARPAPTSTAQAARPAAQTQAEPMADPYAMGASPQPPAPAPNTSAPASGGTAHNLTAFVKEFEGYNPKAFNDYKQISIGYGTRARPGEKVISREEAERRLAAELGSSRQRVERHVQKHGYQLSEKQLDALTSFDYNTGRLEQLTAKGTRTPEVIAKQMLLYNKAGGKVLPGLVRRRKAESSLFQSP